MLEMHRPSNECTVVGGGPCVGRKVDKAGMVLKNLVNASTALLKGSPNIAPDRVDTGNHSTGTTGLHKDPKLVVLDDSGRPVVLRTPASNVSTRGKA